MQHDLKGNKEHTIFFEKSTNLILFTSLLFGAAVSTRLVLFFTFFWNFISTHENFVHMKRAHWLHYKNHITIQMHSDTITTMTFLQCSFVTVWQLNVVYMYYICHFPGRRMRNVQLKLTAWHLAPFQLLGYFSYIFLKIWFFFAIKFLHRIFFFQ